MPANGYELKAALLAAGNSQRFNGIKLLASSNSKEQSLLEQSWRHLNEAMHNSGFNTDGIYTATGAYHEQLKHKLPDSFNLTYCSDAKLGMGHSIAQISHFIEQKYCTCTHLLLALADQIALKTNDYLALINQSRQQPEKIICAQFNENICAPAIFPKKHFSALQQLTGDKGAKKLLLTHTDELTAIRLDNAAIDIDTQQDLQHWQQQITI